MSVYQPPNFEGEKYRPTKYEEPQFKLMLSELKKIKKELVKSQVDESEEPKRLREDFPVIRNLEDPKRQEFRKLFEEGQKTADLNRSLIPNGDLLELRAKQIRELKKGRIDRLLRSVKDVAYFKRLFPLVKEEKPGKDMYARITFWQFVIAIYIINMY